MKTKLLLILVIGILTSCVNSEDEPYDIEVSSESAQQAADSLASIDEIGGDTSGAIAYRYHYEKTFHRLAKDNPSKISDLFISKSYAANCNTMTFTACTGGQRVRYFNGCTTNGPVVEGNQTYGNIAGEVNLYFFGTGAGSCQLSANNDYIQRVPSFTMTGLRGGTFAVSTPTTGQTLKRIGVGTYTFDNTGINRTFTTSGGNVVFNSTTTTTAMTVAGSGRNGRTASGGVTNIINNLTGVTCTLTVNPVLTWNAACNCPISGALTGSCTDGSPLSVTFTATCGEVMLSTTTNKIVTMDRCQL